MLAVGSWDHKPGWNQLTMQVHRILHGTYRAVGCSISGGGLSNYWDLVLGSRHCTPEVSEITSAHYVRRNE